MIRLGYLTWARREVEVQVPTMVTPNGIRMLTADTIDLSGRVGLLFNPTALWLGAHWSGHCRRLCVNLVPCLTVWITLPGGTEP